MTGKEIAILRKEKMRDIVSLFAKEKIATIQDTAKYLQTTESIIEMDLDFLQIAKEDFPVESNQEVLEVLTRKRDQLFAEISQLPQEQHAQECAKYGFCFPEPMYQAFKDSILFEDMSKFDMIQQLLQPIPESEIVLQRLQNKQYKTEKLRHDVSLLYLSGKEKEEISVQLGVSIKNVTNALATTANKANVTACINFKNDSKAPQIENQLVRGVNGVDLVHTGQISSHSLTILKKNLGITSAKELNAMKREDENEQIARLYESGLTQDEVAEIKDITRSSISSKLKEYYKKHPEKYDWDNFKRQHHTPQKLRENKNIQTEKIIESYKQGLSPRKITTQYGLNENTVYQTLRKNGFTIQDISKQVDELLHRRGLVWVTTVLHQERREFDGVIRGLATTDLKEMTGESASVISADISILRNAVKQFGGREALEDYIIQNAEQAKKELNTAAKLKQFLQTSQQQIEQQIEQAI